LRTARLHLLITSSTTRVSASRDPHFPTQRWTLCQSVTSDSVIIAIRGKRRNYMFLLGG
jgi:hypothetical protein